MQKSNLGAASQKELEEKGVADISLMEVPSGSNWLKEAYNDSDVHFWIVLHYDLMKYVVLGGKGEDAYLMPNNEAMRYTFGNLYMFTQPNGMVAFYACHEKQMRLVPVLPYLYAGTSKHGALELDTQSHWRVRDPDDVEWQHSPQDVGKWLVSDNYCQDAPHGDLLIHVDPVLFFLTCMKLPLSPISKSKVVWTPLIQSAEKVLKIMLNPEIQKDGSGGITGQQVRAMTKALPAVIDKMRALETKQDPAANAKKEMAKKMKETVGAVPPPFDAKAANKAVEESEGAMSTTIWGHMKDAVKVVVSDLAPWMKTQAINFLKDAVTDVAGAAWGLVKTDLWPTIRQVVFGIGTGAEAVSAGGKYAASAVKSAAKRAFGSSKAKMLPHKPVLKKFVGRSLGKSSGAMEGEFGWMVWDTDVPQIAGAFDIHYPSRIHLGYMSPNGAAALPAEAAMEMKFVYRGTTDDGFRQLFWKWAKDPDSSFLPVYMIPYRKIVDMHDIMGENFWATTVNNVKEYRQLDNLVEIPAYVDVNELKYLNTSVGSAGGSMRARGACCGKCRPKKALGGACGTCGKAPSCGKTDHVQKLAMGHAGIFDSAVMEHLANVWQHINDPGRALSRTLAQDVPDYTELEKDYSKYMPMESGGPPSLFPDGSHPATGFFPDAHAAQLIARETFPNPRAQVTRILRDTPLDDSRLRPAPGARAADAAETGENSVQAVGRQAATRGSRVAEDAMEWSRRAGQRLDEPVDQELVNDIQRVHSRSITEIANKRGMSTDEVASRVAARSQDIQNSLSSDPELADDYAQFNVRRVANGWRPANPQAYAEGKALREVSAGKDPYTATAEDLAGEEGAAAEDAAASARAAQMNARAMAQLSNVSEMRQGANEAKAARSLLQARNAQLESRISNLQRQADAATEDYQKIQAKLARPPPRPKPPVDNSAPPKARYADEDDDAGDDSIWDKIEDVGKDALDDVEEGAADVEHAVENIPRDVEDVGEDLERVPNLVQAAAKRLLKNPPEELEDILDEAPELAEGAAEEGGIGEMVGGALGGVAGMVVAGVIGDKLWPYVKNEASKFADSFDGGATGTVTHLTQAQIQELAKLRILAAKRMLAAEAAARAKADAARKALIQANREHVGLVQYQTDQGIANQRQMANAAVASRIAARTGLTQAAAQSEMVQAHMGPTVGYSAGRMYYDDDDSDYGDDSYSDDDAEEYYAPASRTRKSRGTGAKKARAKKATKKKATPKRAQAKKKATGGAKGRIKKRKTTKKTRKTKKTKTQKRKSGKKKVTKRKKKGGSYINERGCRVVEFCNLTRKKKKTRK